MNTIVNLGSPVKDLGPIAMAIMPGCARNTLKITGAQVFSSGRLALTSPLYGAGMVLDCLEELSLDEFFRPDSCLILAGSMGSLSAAISVGQIVFPNPSLCAYYGFAGTELSQDEYLLKSLAEAFKSIGQETLEYRHGSSFAVFDPHTDHTAYTSRLYDPSVIGVDCGEVFVGLEFAARRKLRAAAVLYCSDGPKKHIIDVEKENFGQLATKSDAMMNTIAADVLSKSARARP